MSGISLPPRRRSNFASSNLREVSNESNEPLSPNRPVTATSSTGTIRHVPSPTASLVERKCILWTHDESFSKEDVIINLDLFPGVKPGELMAIMALKTDSGVRDFHDKAQTHKHELEALGLSLRRERSNSNSREGSELDGVKQNYDVDPSKRYLFIAKEMPKDLKNKLPSLEVSVSKNIADAFCLKLRSTVLLTTADPNIVSASHVEMTFKDEYLTRSDMWRLVIGDLSNTTVYKGQKILFMGTIKAQVTTVYVNGRKVQSAFFSTDTKPIFRSESARYVLFIQMSREMWDFDSEGSGEIMFNKVVNGFLPALFKKWMALKVKHLVSIVLFSRVEYDTGMTSELGESTHDSEYHTGIQAGASRKPYKDFYRVVVSEMASGEWTTILYQLKREFKFFRRDISMHRIEMMGTADRAVKDSDAKTALGTRIEAEPSLAMHGNVLEAINLAASQFAYDYIDRDLVRTGISLVVITPCAGMFEVDYDALRMTTESLIGNGIGIDLVCLPKMPLHSVPLFRYRNPRYRAFQEGIRYKPPRTEENTPRQNTPIFGSYSSVNDSISPRKSSSYEHNHRNGQSSTRNTIAEWCYAIPYWLDVSFWTGASQTPLSDLTSQSFLTQYQPPWGREHRKSSTRFDIRCKMYEMEMASVVGSIMSEISVRPLQENPHFSKMIINRNELAPRDLKLPSDTVRRETVYYGLSEFVNGPSKSVIDRHTSDVEKPFFRSLDAFDISASELSELGRGHQQKADVKKSLRTSGEENTKKLLLEDRKVFGTSLGDDTGTSKGMSLAAGAITARSKRDLQTSEDVARHRKDSVNSVMTPTPAPRVSAKAPKFGRQISFGKYGFGIAAPKALTAEVHTEHASAGRLIPSSNKVPETKAKPTTSKSTHLLGTPPLTPRDRPPSAQGEKSATSPLTRPVEPKATEKTTTSQPIAIKSGHQNHETSPLKARYVLGSLYEGIDPKGLEELHRQSMKAEDTQKLFTSKLVAGWGSELPKTLSPTTAMAPWLTTLNPSNPSSNDLAGASQYRRWQHVFPRPLHTKTMKWKSLCSPASMPLTTEFFPTKHQLDDEYEQMPYNISQNADDELNESPKSREDFLRELVGLRLCQGFQIVIGPAVAEAFGQKALKVANIFDKDHIARDGENVFMSMGNIIHQLSCVNGTEIEVNMFIRRPTEASKYSAGRSYNLAIRTSLSPTYESRQVVLGVGKGEYNWNYVDSFIAGFGEDMTENLRFWRARFVLIPVARPTLSSGGKQGDNEEETRLEGIKKLTQLWQRHRYLTPSERRWQSNGSRKSKDPNPLDIVYKTEDPSVVISAELETLPLLETGEPATRRGQLLDSERFRRSSLDIASLAEAIQAPVERGGVRMQNRRWHLRLHYNCFIGSDMTTWLLENFEDIETREEAVELGNKLMISDEKEKGKEKDMGLFVHVEKRHPFRDGQYFYQMGGEYAKTRPESRSAWFASRKRDSSVPSTPMTESTSRDSPRPERSRSSSNYDDGSEESGTTTPTGKWPKVFLSKVMRYDVDPRKRSYRPERINLHYDRLHNPDSCYHIRIDWMSTTAKLIEDAIESWAGTAERHGLKLVEVPVREACMITSVNPFRSEYYVKLALEPPERQPNTYFDVSSFTPQPLANRHYYHKAILRKFNFVLDLEAAKNFPGNVDVTYSWGKPDFKYSQYIHRSGVLLAEITDEGHFLLLANSLYSNRTTAAREAERYNKGELGDRGNWPKHGNNSNKQSPFASPVVRPTSMYAGSPQLKASSEVLSGNLIGTKLAGMITPGGIKDELEAFCNNETLLDVFYKEVYEKATPPEVTPPSLKSPHVGSILDANIPVLGLPPSNFTSDSSSSVFRLSNMQGVGSSMPAMGRRPSVQVGLSSESLRQESPRGSITEPGK
ncbi:vacuolar membrane-associated protein-like protein IML1 [Xylogone sp. PMI_703]|nr:vacuolar membrane-associated protein-like protein IML1 [Xylogone sp. PMI_703]